MAAATDVRQLHFNGCTSGRVSAHTMHAMHCTRSNGRWRHQLPGAGKPSHASKPALLRQFCVYA